MKRKKIIKDVTGFTALSIGLGVGSSVVTRAGGSAAPLATISKYTPKVAGIYAMGLGIGAVRELEKPFKKKKNRW